MSEKCESCTCESKKNIQVLIKIDLSKMTEDERQNLTEAELCLFKAGITFDTGSNLITRDWMFDWSLKGPIKVIPITKSIGG